MKHSILVLTPARGGNVSGVYSDSIASLACACQGMGVGFLRPKRNNIPGLLDHSRCVLYGEALDTAATHALWVDGDCAWLDPVAAVLSLLERPELERDCLARVYRSRDGALSTDNVRRLSHAEQQAGRFLTDEEKWHTLHPFGIRPVLEGGRLKWSEDRRLLQMAHCGFGFVLMRIDTMRAFAEQLRERDPKFIGKDWGGRSMVRAFEPQSHVDCRHGGHGNGQPGDESRIAGGEDVAFWQLWCQAGRETWCAPEAYVSNGGIGGVYIDHLREQYDDAGAWTGGAT